MPISMPPLSGGGGGSGGGSTSTGTVLLVSGGDQRLELGGTYTLPVSVFQNDSPAVPALLTLTLRSPTGATNDYTLSAGEIFLRSAGSYGFALMASVTGRWAYTWTAWLNGVSG